MKKILLISIFFIPIVIISSYFYSASLSYTAGPPAGRTGSPGDNFISCASIGCHNSFPTISLTSAIVVTKGFDTVSSYVPGDTLTVNVAIFKNSVTKFGFQATFEDASGNKVGTPLITDATRTQIKNVNWVEHTSAGTSNFYAALWSFDWISPPQGTGDVTFYAAINATNNDGTPTGDTIYLTQTTITETPTSIQKYLKDNIEIFPNPFKNRLYLNNLFDIDKVEIHNANGQLIEEFKINSNKIFINFEKLNAGVYFFKFIEKNKNEIVHRVIKY